MNPAAAWDTTKVQSYANPGNDIKEPIEEGDEMDEMEELFIDVPSGGMDRDIFSKQKNQNHLADHPSTNW